MLLYMTISKYFININGKLSFKTTFSFHIWIILRFSMRLNNTAQLSSIISAINFFNRWVERICNLNKQHYLSFSWVIIYFIKWWDLNNTQFPWAYYGSTYLYAKMLILILDTCLFKFEEERLSANYQSYKFFKFNILLIFWLIPTREMLILELYSITKWVSYFTIF